MKPSATICNLPYRKKYNSSIRAVCFIYALPAFLTKSPCDVPIIYIDIVNLAIQILSCFHFPHRTFIYVCFLVDNIPLTIIFLDFHGFPQYLHACVTHNLHVYAILHLITIMMYPENVRLTSRLWNCYKHRQQLLTCRLAKKCCLWRNIHKFVAFLANSAHVFPLFPVLYSNEIRFIVFICILFSPNNIVWSENNLETFILRILFYFWMTSKMEGTYFFLVVCFQSEFPIKMILFYCIGRL